MVQVVLIVTAVLTAVLLFVPVLVVVLLGTDRTASESIREEQHRYKERVERHRSHGSVN